MGSEMCIRDRPCPAEWRHLTGSLGEDDIPVEECCGEHEGHPHQNRAHEASLEIREGKTGDADQNRTYCQQGQVLDLGRHDQHEKEEQKKPEVP